jgi:hypothetical protein
MGEGVAVVAWVGTGVRLRLAHSAVEAATRRTINWSARQSYRSINLDMVHNRLGTFHKIHHNLWVSSEAQLPQCAKAH